MDPDQVARAFFDSLAAHSKVLSIHIMFPYTEYRLIRLNSLKFTSAAVVFRLCNRGNYLFDQVRMTTSSHVMRLFLIACLFAIGAQSVDLATSQYPFYKANRERNNQLNGNVGNFVVFFV